MLLSQFVRLLVSDSLYALATIPVTGSLIALPICTKLLKLSDYIIIIIGFTDKIFSNLIMVFAKSSIMLYIGASVGFISSIAPIGVRSLATKVVSEDDLGKAQTLFFISEAVGTAIAAPIYNQSYKSLFNTFPSGYFLFGVLVYSISSVLVLCMFYMDKRKDQCEDKEKNVCDKENTNHDIKY